jgi:hypothetical protein
MKEEMKVEMKPNEEPNSNLNWIVGIVVALFIWGCSAQGQFLTYEIPYIPDIYDEYITG